MIFALNVANVKNSNEEVLIEVILKRENNTFTLFLPFTKEEFSFNDYNSDEQMQPIINVFSDLFDKCIMHTEH